MKKIIITGGSGFIGSYVVRHYVQLGWRVEVIDTQIRGDATRFADVANDVVMHPIDVRDENAVTQCIQGADIVMHLAAINGTDNFYTNPALVLDVGIRGALSVVNACKRSNVSHLVIASSAEVYQTPDVIPTDERVKLTLPNSINPRYSYGGSKIISELIAFCYHQEHFEKLQVFRPHNVYGPNMGYKHVIPQCIIRTVEKIKKKQKYFEIFGDGNETRAFCYIDDIVKAIAIMIAKGGHREIYHIGNDDEISIHAVIQKIFAKLGTNFDIQKIKGHEGSATRRCPDITKIRKLGYEPKVTLDEGIEKTIEWYLANADKNMYNDLM